MLLLRTLLFLLLPGSLLLLLLLLRTLLFLLLPGSLLLLLLLLRTLLFLLLPGPLLFLLLLLRTLLFLLLFGPLVFLFNSGVHRCIGSRERQHQGQGNCSHYKGFHSVFLRSIHSTHVGHQPAIKQHLPFFTSASHGDYMPPRP